MGYLRTEKFDSLGEWNDVSNALPGYSIEETDWDSLKSSPEKAATMVLRYVPQEADQFIPGASILTKTYSTPWYFSFDDQFGKPVTYPELMLTFRMTGGETSEFKSPDDFFISMSLWRSDTKLREWFVPLERAADTYKAYCFDLQPLIDDGHSSFDTIRFDILKHGGDRAIYFGDMYLFQDEVEHNVLSSMAEALHAQIRRQCTVLNSQAAPGDTQIHVDSIVDLHPGTAILIGDPDGTHELHVIDQAPYEEPGIGPFITFTGEFSTEKVQMAWAADTPVWFVVPATFTDLTESEAAFPVFFLSFGDPDPVEEMSPYPRPEMDSYVRDTLDGNHTVAVRESRDTLRLPVSIHIYSNRLETAVEMSKFLRKTFNRRNFISVVGRPIEYEVVSHRRLNQDDDMKDQMPHYSMDLDVYPVENPNPRKYFQFPALKVLTTSVQAVEFAVDIKSDC